MRINQVGKIKRFGVLGTVAMVGHALNYYTRKHVLRRASLVRKIHDYRLRIDLHDPGLSRDVAVRGTREEQLKYVIDRVVGPGDVILDVGANIGYYTIMLSKLVGETGMVYAIEPEPRNFERLQKNVQLNGIESIVETHQIGASDAVGTGTLHVSRRSNLHSFLGPTGADDTKGDQSIELPLTDVSTFIRGKRPVDLLRMDIEGYEVEVISGLEAAVVDGSWTGKILFECHFPRYDDDSHSMRKPLRMLFENGYRAKYLTSNDENKPRIRSKGYEPTALVQTSDTRFRGIYENVTNDDAEALVCEIGGVRDILLEKA